MCVPTAKTIIGPRASFYADFDSACLENAPIGVEILLFLFMDTFIFGAFVGGWEGVWVVGYLGGGSSLTRATQSEAL